MDQIEKLLIDIENILSVVSNSIDEVARLKSVEEESKILKEKVFMSQLTQAEQEVFALAIYDHSISEMQNILYKEENTIKNQRRSILEKLNSSSMKEAVQQFKDIHQESLQKLTRIS